MARPARHIGLQFGHIKHFNEGLAEFSKQLAHQYANHAIQLKKEKNWHFHFILPKQWHGIFGNHVEYHELTEKMRVRHRFPIDLDLWHGLHQHMRFRPPINSRQALITVHDLHYVYSKSGLSLWWQNLRTTRQLKKANRLTAISKFTTNDIDKYLPWARNVEVIHNGVADLSLIDQTSIKGVESSSYLLHISRMSHSKNVDAILNMAETWPEQQLILVGPNSEEIAKHRQTCAEKSLDNVRIITDVSPEEKAWLLANCKAFIFPSLMEGFGLPPIEAMFFGKPVIVSNLSSLPEVCGPAASYFKEFTGNEMKTAIVQHIEQHQQQPELSVSTREWAKQYSWESASKKFLVLYESMMNNKINP